MSYSGTAYQRETASLRKWYSWLESRLLRPAEIECCRKADLLVTRSERDRLSLKSMLPCSVIEVVPNGVDTEAFQYGSPKEESGQIIFTGAMDYYPNINAVSFFAQQCWPIIRAQVPNVTWKIVGSNPPPEVRELAELPVSQ